MKKRNKVLAAALTLCLVVTMAVMPQAGFGASAASDIVILYTGDIHGGVDAGLSLAGVVAYANGQRAEYNHVEIVDVGDAVSGNLLANTSEGEYVIDGMNAAGYTMAVPGVRDFDFGMYNLVGTLNLQAKHQYLSSNFVDSNGSPVFKAYTIKTYGDTKIAYVGISDPLTAVKAKDAFAGSSYGFCDGGEGKDLYAKVQEAVDAAKKEGATYVIALSHLSDADGAAYTAESVLANTTGINAMINGSTHKTEAGKQVKTKDGAYAMLTSPGSGLKNFGVMTISAGSRITTQLIGNYNVRDIATTDALAALKKTYEANLSEAFAVTASQLTAVNRSGVRVVESSETNLGDLCADAYKTATGADIAFVESSELKNNIPVGNISYNDVMDALPGNQSISVIQVSGYELMDALEMAARLYPQRSSNFLQVSGITFDIQETVIPSVTTDGLGNFMAVADEYRVTNIMINGKKLDVMTDYTVAGTNALLNGETGYTMFSKCPLKAANVTTDTQALVDYITDDLEGKIGAAYTKSQGRIDSVKLARQSEIDNLVEELAEEKLDEYIKELEELREQVAQQDDIIDIKTMEITASSKFAKTSGKRSITVTWKVSETVDGIKYQIYKSTKKSSGFKKLSTTSKKSYKNSSSLTKGKTYYYKVRAYKYIGNKYYYSDWSNTTSKKVSK